MDEGRALHSHALVPGSDFVDRIRRLGELLQEAALHDQRRRHLCGDDEEVLGSDAGVQKRTDQEQTSENYFGW